MRSTALGFLPEPRKRRGPGSAQGASSVTTILRVDVRRAWATTCAKLMRRASDAVSRGSAKRAPFTRVAPNLYIGEAPADEYVCMLREMRVQAVISLVQAHEPHIDPNLYGAEEALHLPTPDYHSPTTEQLWQAVRFAETHREQVLLVHCRKGKGRSAVCTAAILAHRERLVVAEAHKRIRGLRAISSFRSRQWNVVRRMQLTTGPSASA